MRSKSEVIDRLALRLRLLGRDPNTIESYCRTAGHYYDFTLTCPRGMTSEKKAEGYLSLRVSRDDISTSTQKLHEWKPLPWRPHVEVSNLGLVRRKCFRDARGHLCKERLLKQYQMPNGYLTVSVKPPNGSREIPMLVHRLVCWAFNGPPPFDESEVRHLDGCRVNNEPENLAWGTSAENASDRNRHGTHRRGDSSPRSRIKESDVPVIRSRVAAGESQPIVAHDFNVCRQTIGLICQRKTFAHVA